MATNADISNLPSPEELDAAPKAADISSLPSPDQLEAKEGPKWNKLESAGQGALQGATAGFSDELGGLEGALMEKVLPGGNADKKSLADLYQEYRDVQRNRNNQAQSQNPGSYLAGNIAGGILPAAATGGSIAGATALGAATGLGTSSADLVHPDAQQLGDAAKDAAIGGALGAAGGVVGKGLAKLFNPQALDAAGSKAISSGLDISPKKEITKIFNPDTGAHELNSNVVRGIGKTAQDSGSVPMFGGPDAVYAKATDAIQQNSQKIQPLLQQAQQSLDPVLDDTLDNVGYLKDKISDFSENYLNNLPESSQKNAIVNKIVRTYGPQLDELAQNDGNLVALNDMKQNLQKTAQSLNAYRDTKLAPEAQFVKQLGGIVRQHIEDLANAADPSSDIGEQISHANGALSDLFTVQDAAAKAIQNPSKIFGLDSLVSAIPKAMTGYDAQQAAGIGVGKALLGASKAVQTPMGQLVQKTVPKAAQSFISNPFSTSMAQSLAPGSNEQLSNYLNNSTDDSLHQVSSEMKNNVSTKEVGEQLNNAITNNNDWAKKAAIMKILQNPAAKKLLKPESE